MLDEMGSVFTNAWHKLRSTVFSIACGILLSAQQAAFALQPSIEEVHIDIALNDNSTEIYTKKLAWIVGQESKTEGETEYYLGVYTMATQLVTPIHFSITRNSNVVFTANETHYVSKFPNSEKASFGKSQQTQLYVRVPSLQEGDRIDWKFQRKGQSWAFSNLIDFHETLDYAADSREFSIKIDSPRGLVVNIESIGFNLTETSDLSGRKSWSYKGTVHSAEIADEPRSSSKTDQSPAITISTYSDWKALGDAYLEGERAAAGLGFPKSLLAEIVGKAKDERTIAVAIYSWIQRYFQYDTTRLSAENYVRPRNFKAVLDSKTADCKEMVMMFNAAMSQKGIVAKTVGVSAFGFRYHKPSIPTFFPFDHVISYIPSLNIFIDPTQKNGVFGVPAQGLLGKPSLVFGSPDLTRIQLSTELSKSTTIENIYIEDDGTVKSTATVSATGTQAQALADMTRDIYERSVSFQDFLLQKTGIEVERATMDSVDAKSSSGIFSINTQVTFSERFSEKTKFTKFPEGITIPSLYVQIPVYPAKLRVNSIICAFADTASTETVYHFPANFKLQNIDGEKMLIDGGIFQYERSITKLPSNVVSVKRNLLRESNSATCPASDFKKWVALWRKIIGDYDQTPHLLFEKISP